MSQGSNTYVYIFLRLYYHVRMSPRTPGRPKTGEETGRTGGLIAARVAPWVRKGLVRLARAQGKNLSDVANDAYASHLAKHGITEEKQP